MGTRSALLLCLLLATAPSARADGARGSLNVSFAATSTLHDFEGTAAPVAVSLTQDANGAWSAHVTIPVADLVVSSFTTVLKAGPTGDVLATNTLTLLPDEKAQASRFDGAMGGGKGKGAPKGDAKAPPAKGKQGGGGGGPGNFDRPGVYGVAAADGRLLLRTGSHLYCVGP